MNAHALRGAWKPLRAMLPWAALAIAGVLLPGTLASCDKPGKPAPTAPAIEAPPGVPTIRVLLGSSRATAARVATTGGYALLADGRTVLKSDDALPDSIVSRNGDAWRFNETSIEAESVSLRTSPASHCKVAGATYRGDLRFLPAIDAPDAFAIVNHVDIESYLCGVLSRELYPDWHDETYAALAVAARTFALYHMKTTGTGKRWDVGDGQASQVYGGLTGETDKSRRAVKRTFATVLVHGEGTGRIFMTQYSSCCGGRVNGARVIRPAADIEPLRGGQVCTDCRASSKYRWPPVRIPKTDILQALKSAYSVARSLTGITAIRVTEATGYGRAVWIDVVDGDGGSVRIRAEDLRLALLRSGAPSAKRLYSMNCRWRDVGDAMEFYDGRGFGHGVGLCQWGAQGKAIRGLTAEEILESYYPGSRRVRAY